MCDYLQLLACRAGPDRGIGGSDILSQPQDEIRLSAARPLSVIFARPARGSCRRRWADRPLGLDLDGQAPG